MPFLIVATIVSVLAGVCAHYLARRKGRAVKPWVIASVLFILPVVILLLLPGKTDGALLNGT